MSASGLSGVEFAEETLRRSAAPALREDVFEQRIVSRVETDEHGPVPVVVLLVEERAIRGLDEERLLVEVAEGDGVPYDVDTSTSGSCDPILATSSKSIGPKPYRAST